ncbi:MAG: NFACT RNA binding domain-containing protein [Candidatus Cloacimonetes bacterium]|nr:NFACT RNA binding domain-containing protein [Candidatus Cloacimonadota bacterium]
MQYKYLEEWVNTTSYENLYVHKIVTYQDQTFFFFKKKKIFLQINLSSENSFCFFGEKIPIPEEKCIQSLSLENFFKHSKLKKISLISQDRIISFLWEKVDIYNQKQEYTLIVELIPRFQNLIVIDHEKKIIFAKKKFSFADNNQRQILPGVEYHAPQTDFKIQTSNVKYPVSIKDKQIIENSDLKQSYNNLNDLFYEIYYNHILKNQLEFQRKKILDRTSKEIKKKEKKLVKLQAELADASQKQKWLTFAELLKGNLGKIKKGMTKIEVTDYFQEELPKIEIAILSDKTPKQNLEYYFKKYRKARDGKIKIQERIIITKDEIENLTKEKFDILEADIFDFISSSKQKKINRKKNSTYLKSLKINDEWEIFVGRTSKENDFLTTRFAKPYDWWFHTRIFRGTHVILRNYKKQELNDDLKIICAELAAYYSKAKKSENVPVDYTEIRFVRKPRGSAPGFVTYKNQKTLYVDPISMREAKELINNKELKDKK